MRFTEIRKLPILDPKRSLNHPVNGNIPEYPNPPPLGREALGPGWKPNSNNVFESYKRCYSLQASSAIHRTEKEKDGDWYLYP